MAFKRAISRDVAFRKNDGYQRFNKMDKSGGKQKHTRVQELYRHVDEMVTLHSGEFCCTLYKCLYRGQTQSYQNLHPNI